MAGFTAALLLLFAIRIPLSRAQPALPEGEQLRQSAAAYNMDLGFSAPFLFARGVDPREEQIVRNQASMATIQLTSSNWPAPRVVDFQQALAQLQWLKNAQKKVHLHMLVGNHITPDWFANGTWTHAQLDDHLEFWIREVAKAFGNDIDSVVVVNEAVWDPAATGGNTWNNSGSFGTWWGMKTDIYGGSTPEYARRAFELARFYFPANVKLVYNDYNHGNTNGKSDAIYNFVQHLAQSDFTKPDVIGFQAHYEIGIDNQIRALDQGPSTPLLDFVQWGRNVDRYSNLGIESHITELDVQIPANQPQWRREQAKLFGRIADFAAARSDITAMTCWVNFDGADPGWIPNQSPTLFDTNGSPKEAFYGVQLGLHGVLLDRTYRISDAWTRNYVLVGNGNVGTQAVTHRSNPSWGVGKWTVRPGPNGAFRLQSQAFPSRSLSADSDGNVRLRQGSNVDSQLWRVRRGASRNRTTLVNQDAGLFLNANGTSNNTRLSVWFQNGLGNQDWFFELEQN